jgi:hypothetical protein
MEGAGRCVFEEMPKLPSPLPLAECLAALLPVYVVVNFFNSDEAWRGYEKSEYGVCLFPT